MRHHGAQYANVNRLIVGRRYEGMTSVAQILQQSSLVPADIAIFNNAGQAYNHDLYWSQFKPGGVRRCEPLGALKAKIDSDLGGLDKMKADLVRPVQRSLPGQAGVGLPRSRRQAGPDGDGQW